MADYKGILGSLFNKEKLRNELIETYAKLEKLNDLIHNDKFNMLNRYAQEIILKQSCGLIVYRDSLEALFEHYNKIKVPRI